MKCQICKERKATKAVIDETTPHTYKINDEGIPTECEYVDTDATQSSDGTFYCDECLPR